MKRITLGKTGLEVSPLCIGTWQLAGPVSFGGQPDGHPDPGEEAVISLIRNLGERGLNFIDCAEQYGEGEGERRTGLALKGCREDWVISTKFGYRVGAGGTRIDDSSPATILPSLEGSLRRLETDYVDIFLYHCAPDFAGLDEAQQILTDAKKAGKVRFVGISTSRLNLVEELHGRGLLDVLQFPTNLLKPAKELSQFASKNEVATQVRGVLAQGRLSGKYLSQQPEWRGDDNRSRLFPGVDFSIFSELTSVLPDGYTLGHAAIRWALEQEGHDSLCLGAKSLFDYEMAIEALDLPPLDASVSMALEELANQLMTDS